ncbi:hypothetical protein BH09BAC2_BH09BAC2_13560 [soil metagenome]
MRFILFFLIITIILAPSCNKKKQEPSPHVNTFTANVNGTAFVTTGIEILFGGSSVPGARQVNVYANAANGHIVTLIMLDYNSTVKTFTQSIGVYSIAPGINNSSYSTGGQIVISSIGKSTYTDGEVVTGTFQFDTDATVGIYHITNGNFSVFVKH